MFVFSLALVVQQIEGLRAGIELECELDFSQFTLQLLPVVGPHMFGSKHSSVVLDPQPESVHVDELHGA